MKILTDLHTHTLPSGHAYSTISENIEHAAKIGLKAIALTEHGPAMPGSCNEFYYCNFVVIPRNVDGIEVFMGAEANIIDYNGNIDLKESILEELDIVIASLHRPCITSGSKKENTRALIKAMENKYINIIGHPCDPRYPFYIEDVVKASIETGTFLEINNASLVPGSFRDGGEAELIQMLNACIKYGAKVSVGSDAHFSGGVGNFVHVLKLFEQISMPEELIINNSVHFLMQNFRK